MSLFGSQINGKWLLICDTNIQLRFPNGIPLKHVINVNKQWIQIRLFQLQKERSDNNIQELLKGKDKVST